MMLAGPRYYNYNYNSVESKYLYFDLGPSLWIACTVTDSLRDGVSSVPQTA